MVSGYFVANDKIKGCGKLRVVGTLEGTDVEIYGNVSITGYLYVFSYGPYLDVRLTKLSKCRRLVVYGNLTLIGGDSSYYVEESEQVAGAVMVRDTEPDWDW